MSEPQRITWPFEVTARLVNDAVSKEAIIDYLFSSYSESKRKFEQENDCEIEWIEIRVKRKPPGRTESIVGFVEFKKVGE